MNALDDCLMHFYFNLQTRRRIVPKEKEKVKIKLEKEKLLEIFDEEIEKYKAPIQIK